MAPLTRGHHTVVARGAESPAARSASRGRYAVLFPVSLILKVFPGQLMVVYF